jgi:hypothetical protein
VEAGAVAAGRPVFALDVGDDDVNRVGLAAKNFNADAGNRFSQLFLLFDGAAFHHFDVVRGHGFLGV